MNCDTVRWIMQNYAPVSESRLRIFLQCHYGSLHRIALQPIIRVEDGDYFPATILDTDVKRFTDVRTRSFDHQRPRLVGNILRVVC